MNMRCIGHPGQRWTLALALAGAALLSASAAWSQTAAERPPGASAANLNINPKRVTFDRLGKSAAIYVFNQGAAPGSFDVQLIDRLMLPSGQIIPLTDAGDRPELRPLVDLLKSARDMLVATPRRVKLSGNAGQTIRLRAATTADIPPGEYRTHLTVTAIPPSDAGLTADRAATDGDRQVSLRVNTVLGLSIPVIIRIGKIDVRAGIDHTQLTYEVISSDGRQAPIRTAILSFELVRMGVNSLFGDIEVRGNKEHGGKEPIGTVRGIGVYPEIERRSVRIALRRIPAPGEQLAIVFRDDDVTPGKQLIRAIVPAP